MELYGTKGYEIAVSGDRMRGRVVGDPAESEVVAKPLTNERQNPLDYLTSVIQGQIQDDEGLSSLDINVVVVQILAAARESARTGRTVSLHPLRD